MLANLKTDNSIQEQGDSLGGFSLLETGVYDMIIDMAYIDLSKNGAYGLVLSLKGAGKESHRETIWMTNSESKGQLNYYIDREGNKQYLPGFSQANALSLLTLEKEISEIEPEEKTIKVYNPELKKEAPTAKQVVTEMLGKAVKVGIVKQIVDKTAKAADGTYQPTGETREENIIDKLFHAETGVTIAEARAGVLEGEFIHKWEDKNKGETRNKAKGAAGGNAGAPSASNAPAGEKKSLFGQKAA